jgi:hypothetical protein
MNKHPRVSRDDVELCMTDTWMTLEEIVIRCGIAQSERRVVLRRIDELVNNGKVIRHFNHSGRGCTQEYSLIKGNRIYRDFPTDII